MYYKKKKKENKCTRKRTKTHPWEDDLYLIIRKMETHVSGIKEYFIKKKTKMVHLAMFPWTWSQTESQDHSPQHLSSLGCMFVCLF